MSLSETAHARRRFLQQQQQQQQQRQKGRMQGDRGERTIGSESERMFRQASKAMPVTAKIRWGAMAALTIFMVTAIAVIGVETRKRYDTLSKANNNIARTERLLAQTDKLFQENLGVQVPVCVAFGQEDLDIGSTFPDALFGVHTPGDPDAIIRFDLGDVIASQPVTLTVQDASGIVAHLSDIVPITTEFADDEFRMHNQADETKEIQFDLANLLSSTTVMLAVQNVSGTVAYLSDLIAVGEVFLDSEFTIFNAADPTKRFMFDASLISPSTSRTLENQLTNGTIAYVADINAVGFPVSDADFELVNAADSSKRMRFNVSNVPTSTQIQARIQNHPGTIAYIDDTHAVLPYEEVVVTTTRPFPDIGVEGVATISELGEVYRIEVSLCGGGGAGGDLANAAAGAGGGSGSGHMDFPIANPADRYTHLNIAIDPPLSGPIGPGAAGLTGGMTRVDGVSVTADTWVLRLRGYGGQGGEPGMVSPAEAVGGGGGGSAGVAVATTPGPAGTQGGFEGGLGGNWPNNTNSPDGLPGMLTSSWRAGGGGGGLGGKGAAFFGTSYSVDCPNGSGGAGCGANSMFGRGGFEASPAGALCAGGSGGSSVNSPGVGGGGAVLIRYYLRGEE